MDLSKEYNPAPKIIHKSKKKDRNFSPSTKKAIFERDNYQCVKCKSYMIESVPHHIIYKKQLGTGEKRNGVTVCRSCHDWAHHKADSKFGETRSEGRKWFEEWRDKHLDEKGDYIE